MKSRKVAAPVDPVTMDLFLEKLALSGLDQGDAIALGIEPVAPADTAALNFSFDAKPALRLNYFDAWGKPMADWPASDPFYRLRYLGSTIEFAAIADRSKDRRYVQLPGSLPCLYLPRTYNWADALPDTDISLIITEGELKAAAGVKAGFPVMGLGGVWNFRCSKYGMDLLPALEDFDWRRRNVYVVFDSDLSTKEGVVAALRQLAVELERRGAFVYLAWLPEVLGPDTKVGLDDFLVFHGASAEAEFTALLHDADALGLTKSLFELNERYVYVANPGLLIDKVTQAKHKPDALKSHLAAPLTTSIKELTAEGLVRYKRVSAGAEWMKWPLRAEVHRITYAPGGSRLVTENGLVGYNTWAGWGCKPVKGDVTPFRKLLDHLFTGTNKATRQWFERWLAYPLQYPGSKVFSSAVIHGRRHGTGKSLVGYTMAEIYGVNFTEIKQDDLHTNFNEWAENRQFVMGDDVTGSNKRQDNDILKKLITQKMNRVNPKYVPSYEVRDCINYLFTSNHADSFFLEDDDRRFFIHEVMVAPLPEEFYMEYGLWLASGGASAVFDYLMNLDLGDFNPNAPALNTNAKERMIADVRSDLGSWTRHLLESPDVVLKVGEIAIQKDLFTNKDLLMLYDPTGRTGTTANGLGRELRRAGAIQVLDGRPIKTKAGQDRYYILRNPERWAKATPAEVVAHLDASTKGGKARRAGY